MTVANEQHAIKDQAIDWVIHFAAETQTDESKRRFGQWFEADQRHGQAYKEAQEAWDTLRAIKHNPERVAAESLNQALLREYLFSARQQVSQLFLGTPMRWAAPLSLVVLVAALLMPFFKESPVSAATSYGTQIAEIKDYTLSDGSRVTLGAKSEISVHFTELERRVSLKAGDAFFSVEKAPGRPFVVTAGESVVRVVGTEFDLHYGLKEVRVAVVEGVVQVLPTGTAGSPNKADIDPLVLDAGKRVTVTSGVPGLVQAFNVTSAAEWRSGYLAYNDASLAEVVANANRYGKQPIVLSDPVLGELRVTTAYHGDQVEQLIKTLELVLPLTASQTPLGILLKPKK